MDISLEEYYLKPENLEKEHKKLSLDGVELNFDAIQITDIILKDDYEELIKGIKNIFYSDLSAKIEFDRRNLWEWLNDESVFGQQYLQLISSRANLGVLKLELSDSVEFIKIILQKSCSEFISLNITFFLKDKVKKTFSDILNYIEKPEFKEEYNIENYGSMVSIIESKKIKTDKLKNFYISIKKEVILFISQYIPLGELYKSPSDDFFSQIPHLNVFSFSGDKEKLLNNNDFLSLIGFGFIEHDIFTLEPKYYLANKNNILSLIINLSQFSEKFGYNWILEESLQLHNLILEYSKLLVSKIDKDIKSILSEKKNSNNQKQHIQKTLAYNVYKFERIKHFIERIHFEDLGFLRMDMIENSENRFFKIHEEKLKQFLIDESRIIAQSISSIDTMINLDNTNQNKKIQSNMLYLTYILLFIAVIQILLTKYGEYTIIESLIEIIKIVFNLKLL